MKTIEVWKVLIVEGEQGWSNESRDYYVEASSAAQAERVALLVAKKDKEIGGVSDGDRIFRTPVCSSASFECYVHVA